MTGNSDKPGGGANTNDVDVNALTLDMPVVDAKGAPLARPPIEPDPAKYVIAATAAVANSAPTTTLADETNRQAALDKLNISAPIRPGQPESDLEKPKPRKVCYLLIDGPTFENERNSQIIKAAVILLAEASAFNISRDPNGNLRVMSLSERGGLEQLVAVERSISKQIPDAKMLLDLGWVEQTGKHKFSFKNYPETSPEASWRQKSQYTTRVSRDLASEVENSKTQQSKSRIGKNIIFYTEESDNPAYLYLKEAIDTVGAEEGGSDCMIGYEKELEELLEAIVSGNADLVLMILKGEAFKGKSRLRTELCKKLASYVLLSCNASDATVPGSSLLTLAKQIASELRKDQLEKGETAAGPVEDLRQIINGQLVTVGNLEIDDKPLNFAEFCAADFAEQIAMVRANPDAVSKACMEALKTRNSTKDPHMPLLIEDLHHADSFSLPFLVQIMKAYKQETSGLPIVFIRSEEEYKCKDLTDYEEELKAEKGPAAVKEISIEKGLDFKANGHSLAYKFAFHSLPVEMRTGRKLGNWPEKLAELAGNTPGHFKLLMDAVTETDPDTCEYKNLGADSDPIELTPKFAAELKDLKPEDLMVFFHRRIEELPKTQLQILRCLALLNEAAPYMLIIKLAQHFGTFDESGSMAEQLSQIYKPLTAGKHLIPTGDESGSGYRLQHEDIRAIALQGVSQERIVEMAELLRELISENNIISIRGRHQLATLVSGNYMEESPINAAFWQDFKAITDAYLSAAKACNCNQDIYNVCATTLGTEKLQEAAIALQGGYKDSTTPLDKVEATERMRNAPGIPAPVLPDQSLIELAISTLLTQARAAVYLSKFDVVKQNIAILQRISLYHPFEVPIEEVHMIDFDRAYYEFKPSEMRAISAKLLASGLSKPQKAMVQIKLAFKEDRFNDVAEIYAQNREELKGLNTQHVRENDHPLPIYLEIKRIAEARCPIEAIRNAATKLDGKTQFDTDVLWQPGALNAKQTADLAEVKRTVTELLKTRKSNPMCFDQYAEFNLLEQQAEIAAFSGHADHAIALFGEARRVAAQIGLRNPAARSARLRGDMQVQKATNKNGELDSAARQDLLRKAINTYTKEGLVPLEKVTSPSLYQFTLRIQRVRAIGHLASSGITKDELQTHFQTALEDLKFFSSEQCSKYFQGESNGETYCILSSFGHILTAAKGHEIDIPEDLFDTKKHHFMTTARLHEGIAYGQNMTDLGFGEVETKMQGLHLMSQFFEQQDQEKNKATREELQSNPEKYQLICRLHRLERIADLVKSQAALPAEKRMKPTSLRIFIETAIHDFRYLGGKDFAKHFSQEVTGFLKHNQDLLESALKMNFKIVDPEKDPSEPTLNLHNCFTEILTDDKINPERIKNELTNINGLIANSGEYIYQQSKADRISRDAKLKAAA